MLCHPEPFGIRLKGRLREGSRAVLRALRGVVVRERQLKGWTKSRKLALIYSHNPEIVDYARRTARDPSRRRPPLRMTEGAKGR
jgi:hypothetical protein